MKFEIPFLSKEQLENAAEELRQRHYTKYEAPSSHVVPLDDIAEFTIGYDVTLRNMKTHNLLGCIDFPKKQIFICSSLDPENYPNKIGRYMFTLAHEVAHAYLHASCFFDAQREAEAKEIRISFCQESRAERQANYFAAALLMDRSKVCRMFREPIKLKDYDVTSFNQANVARLCRSGKLSRIQKQELESECIRQCGDYASVFGVSKTALFYRLKDLGLVVH